MVFRRIGMPVIFWISVIHLAEAQLELHFNSSKILDRGRHLLPQLPPGPFQSKGANCYAENVIYHGIVLDYYFCLKDDAYSV